MAKGLKKENQRALMQILADPDTPADVQVSLWKKILSDSDDSTFFETMFRELASYGECPFCAHENHWAVPEKELNLMGYVSSDKDPRVKPSTTDKDCPEFGQACPKKKLGV